MSTVDELTEVFRTVFNDPSIQIKDSMTANDVEGWDSLSHINLIMAVETKFNIEFTPKEVRSFKNIGELIQAIEKKR